MYVVRMTTEQITKHSILPIIQMIDVITAMMKTGLKVDICEWVAGLLCYQKLNKNLGLL